MTKIKAGHTVEFELKDVIDYFNEKYDASNDNLKKCQLEIESGVAPKEVIENMKTLIKGYATIRLNGRKISSEILESDIKGLID